MAYLAFLLSILFLVLGGFYMYREGFGSVNASLDILFSMCCAISSRVSLLEKQDKN